MQSTTKLALTLAAISAPCALASPPAPASAQTASDILLISIDGVGAELSADGAPVTVTDRDGYDNQPAFTSDGGLLFTSIRDGQADTYRYDLATGETRRITQTAESEYSPTPMEGGARFSVVRVEADSTQRLWSFAADGTDPRLILPDTEPVGYHAWAGADRVALFVLGEPATLRLARLSGGEPEILARGIGRSLRPHPTSGAITFTQQTPDGWRIRSLDPATGATEDVAPLPDPEGYHAWTPDGHLLAAVDRRLVRWDGARWITLVDLADRGVGRLTRLTVSPDGRRIAVVADRVTPDDADPGTGVEAAQTDDTARTGPEADAATLPVRSDGSLFSFGTLVFGSLLAMVNPLGALTIFVGLTGEADARHRRASALWACLTAAGILLVFAMFGAAILRFFGITTHAFRIAGGILFFGIGWDMLQARRSRSKTTPEEELESASRHEVAVVPLGIPTLAGPGAITTVIALMGQADGAAQVGTIYIAIVAVLAVSLLVLLAGPALLRLLGQTGINVMTRLMGLLVMVVGVQFVIDGVGTVVTGLINR